MKAGIADPAIFQQEEGHPGERKDSEGKTDAGAGFCQASGEKTLGDKL